MKKNILLIGGSTGIGLEIAKKLYKNHNIYIASRNKVDHDNLEVTHLEFDVLKNDISSLDLPEQLDGLVYCPGSINLKPFKMLKPKDFEQEMQLNFFGLIKVVNGLMPKLKESNQASLVFFSSVAVKVGMPFHTSVAAAKGAIEGFAKSLAAEYAPSLRVNVVSPSLTDTPLAEKLLNNDKKKEKMDQRHPLKRVGTTADIANMTAFLLSEESSWITGQILGVDGGLSTLNIS
ncbi:MAG: NAD(P)-dependent oxidoreductase [Zunongwangia sp.]|jgi:NAD(P)-dependent dehydrogenase (short-subunit alcohol dehydrogenase family)|uniref:Short-chain dehydrogenase/reductase family protein n=2 Tax=Zunongwangia profunda TaxID=398743 RepID=D5BC39_ZUNPS|nr:SDR family oxidoreductase [Zunongwangia profunda]MAG87097.1 NAD(P)-dependent oxidoreductase [Flavobacteriaceae bacterium]MAO35528.1 NAD(P)-dependent oxidoreductase [Zunongwangia sp.]ADF52638.1 short-chain dehydrogenase/reductase family protein [Zunongwangia profunda SM-A87]MAS71438.1 NAD(P)-dependent oxidoreductase [Zunongwangia sp.]HAJ82095.1 SDR family NAD(P)-dependent oxidoreductase [Zunongwangia profunda]|tara:strand:- start:1248 stop:1946 length:699 start_codon:yes stop_codon:yes gene_type:complete